MKIESFRMSIESIETTDESTFFNGQIEQGILYDYDSIRLGRTIFPIKILRRAESETYSPELILTPVHHQPEGYVDSQYWYTVGRSIQLMFPSTNIPEHLVENARKIYYVNRNYFYMVIEDIFNIKGRGVVITGNVRYGRLELGERIRLTCDEKEDIYATVSNLDSGFNRHEFTTVDDNMGIFMNDVALEDVKGRFVATTEGLSEANE